MPTHLDLFSGIGGFALAAQRVGFQTIAFSEIDPYASAVLAKRFPGVPNLGDIRNVSGSSLCEVFDYWNDLTMAAPRKATYDEWHRNNQPIRKEVRPKEAASSKIDLLTGGFP